MNVYIYICACIKVYAYTHACVYTCLYIYIDIHISQHARIAEPGREVQGFSSPSSRVWADLGMEIGSV